MAEAVSGIVGPRPAEDAIGAAIAGRVSGICGKPRCSGI